MLRPIRVMKARGIASNGPLLSKAVVTDAAIGTLAAVPTRKMTRVLRALPGTAFAAHVICDHGSQRRTKIRAACPTPVQFGSWMSRLASWE